MRSVAAILLMATSVALIAVQPAAGRSMALQSHSFCAEGVTIDLSGQETCPTPEAEMSICLTGTPSADYWTNRAGGVGTVVWSVSGTAVLTAGGLDTDTGTETISFGVQGTYGWVTRTGPDGLEWTVANPPIGSLTATNPTQGSFSLRIVGGTGHVVDGAFTLDGDMSFEIAEAGDFSVPASDREGIGAVTSQQGIVDGGALSNPDFDTDGDGVADGVDNAMTVANPDQQDTDGDGLGDVIDFCPSDPLDRCARIKPVQQVPTSPG